MPTDSLYERLKQRRPMEQQEQLQELEVFWGEDDLQVGGPCHEIELTIAFGVCAWSSAFRSADWLVVTGLPTHLLM